MLSSVFNQVKSSEPSEVPCHCNSISMQLNLPVLWEGDIALINLFFFLGGGVATALSLCCKSVSMFLALFRCMCQTQWNPGPVGSSLSL